jgi:hypothetical protein
MHDNQRNFIVLLIACLLNFAFAMEKFLSYIGNPLSDFVLFMIYGGISIVLAIAAFCDYYHDIKEGNKNEPNII